MVKCRSKRVYTSDSPENHESGIRKNEAGQSRSEMKHFPSTHAKNEDLGSKYALTPRVCPNNLEDVSEDEICEVDWDSRSPITLTQVARYKKHSVDISNLVMQSTDDYEALPTSGTPPLLGLWMSNSKTRDKHTRQHRPYRKERRRGRPSGIKRAVSTKDMFLKLASVLNEQTSEADTTAPLESNQRRSMRLSQKPATSSASSSRCVDPAEASYDLSKSSVFGAQARDAAIVKIPPTETLQPKHKNNEQSTPKRPSLCTGRPKNHLLQFSLNESQEDLWTDEELFLDDSFVMKATQMAFEEKSPKPTGRIPKRKTPNATRVKSSENRCSEPLNGSNISNGAFTKVSNTLAVSCQVIKPTLPHQSYSSQNKPHMEHSKQPHKHAPPQNQSYSSQNKRPTDHSKPPPKHALHQNQSYSSQNKPHREHSKPPPTHAPQQNQSYSSQNKPHREHSKLPPKHAPQQNQNYSSQNKPHREHSKPPPKHAPQQRSSRYNFVKPPTLTRQMPVAHVSQQNNTSVNRAPQLCSVTSVIHQNNPNTLVHKPQAMKPRRDPNSTAASNNAFPVKGKAPAKQSKCENSTPRKDSSDSDLQKHWSSPSPMDMSLTDDLLASLAEPDDLLDSQVVSGSVGSPETLSALHPTTDLKPKATSTQMSKVNNLPKKPEPDLGEFADEDADDPELLALLEFVESSQEKKEKAESKTTGPESGRSSLRSNKTNIGHGTGKSKPVGTCLPTVTPLNFPPTSGCARKNSLFVSGVLAASTPPINIPNCSSGAKINLPKDAPRSRLGSLGSQKCSKEEIERKKQEALKRRQNRLKLASHRR